MCLLVMLQCLLSSFARLLKLVAVQPEMSLWQKAGWDTRASYVRWCRDYPQSPAKLAGQLAVRSTAQHLENGLNCETTLHLEWQTAPLGHLHRVV